MNFIRNHLNSDSLLLYSHKNDDDVIILVVVMVAIFMKLILLACFVVPSKKFTIQSDQCRQGQVQVD